jgi:hypothetical protein
MPYALYSGRILAEHHVTPGPGIERRRSERMLLDVPVIVRGEAADQHSFREETFTVTVSAHGALLLLATGVRLGQKLVLMNPKTSDECEGHVASLGSPYAGLSQVAVEFNRPSPEFWSLPSPPTTWKSPSF